MAAAHDAVSFSSTFSTTTSWTHTPAGVPRGVLVLVGSTFYSTGTITGVSYGGQALTQVALSPVTFALSTEPDVQLSAWFLGSGLPSGGQTVTVTVGVAYDIHMKAAAITLTAAADMGIEDTSTNGSETNVTACTVTMTVANTSQSYGIMWNGTDDSNLAQLTDDSGTTRLGSYTTSNECMIVSRATATSASDTTIAWTTSVAHVYGALGVAIRELAVASEWRGPVTSFIRRG